MRHRSQPAALHWPNPLSVSHLTHTHSCPTPHTPSIWLNNCVGERNYRWFLAFLYLNALLMAYGVWAALAVLLHDIESLKLLTAVFTKGGKQVRATYSIVGQYLLGSRTEVCMVGALCVVMGVLVLAFALYHTCLAGSNTTTNESVKWGRLKDARDACEREYRRAVAGIAAADRALAAAEAAAAAGQEGCSLEHKVVLASAVQQARDAVEASRRPPRDWDAMLRHAGLPAGTAFQLREVAPLAGNAYDRGCLRNLWEMCAPQRA